MKETEKDSSGEPELYHNKELNEKMETVNGGVVS